MSSVGLGLSAQGFTFVTIFLPVLFHQNEVLVPLVQASALATVLVQTSVLAIEIRGPSEPDGGVLSRMYSSSLTALLLVVVVLVGAGTLFRATHDTVLGVACIGAGLILLGQGSYTLMLAHLTREHAYPALMRARFLYGAVVFALTLVACLADAPVVWFCGAITVAYAVGVLAGFWSSRPRFSPVGLRTFGSEVRRGTRLSAAYLLGGVSGQLGSLSVGLVGPTGAAWAIVCRVMSGMQTVGGQLVGPLIDMRVASSVRTGESDEARTAVKRGLGLGLVLGLLFALGSVAAIWWSRPELPDDLIPLAAAGIGFALAYVVQAPVARSLGMVGSHNARLAWEASRFIVAFPSFVFLRGDWLLIALGVQGVLVVGTYVILCTARRASDGVPTEDALQ